jgi:hypothetical protein
MEGGEALPGERPDFGAATEPNCPACGETLVLGRCPAGHTEDPLLDAEIAERPREQVGELAEDS